MSIFVIAFTVGMILPALSAVLIFRSRPDLKVAHILFLSFQILQVISERVLAAVDLRYVIKYTALVFIVYRLFQLWKFGKLRGQLEGLKPFVRGFVISTFVMNVLLWSYVAVRLVSRILVVNAH